MSTDVWTASCIVLVLGAIASAAGAILKSYGGSARPYAGYAEARVVDIIPVKRDAGFQSEFRNRLAAVFQYYADGKLIQVTDREDTYPCPYRLHQKVRICYNPENPEQYAVLHRDSLRIGAIALRVLGIVLIVAGGLLFLAFSARYLLPGEL